jgi:hypothetical protein
MVLKMRRLAVALAVVLLATSACKSPPPHTDSTKGTTRSDTGMHDGPQM